MSQPIYEAREISKSYRRRGRGWFPLGAEKIAAVDRVSITLNEGQVSALIGESGSGKSTLGRLLAMLAAWGPSTRRSAVRFVARSSSCSRIPMTLLILGTLWPEPSRNHYSSCRCLPKTGGSASATPSKMSA